jgi:hypothetical protein
VVTVPSGGEVEFELDDGASRLRAGFGVMPQALKGERADGLRFVVELRAPGGAARALLERELWPSRVPGDRGTQRVELELPPGEGRTLALRVLAPSGRSPVLRSYWRDVRIDSTPAPAAPAPGR